MLFFDFIKKFLARCFSCETFPSILYSTFLFIPYYAMI
nr:MAG TPA: hypothetical protein [Caudoviricetes sp.]